MDEVEDNAETAHITSFPGNATEREENTNEENDVRLSPDIRISPVLVVSDDEASTLSDFSIRSMSLDSTLPVFTYEGGLEGLPQSSMNEYGSQRSYRSASSSSVYQTENNDNVGRSGSFDENNHMIADSMDGANANQVVDVDNQAEEQEHDRLIDYSSDNGEEYVPTQTIRCIQPESSSSRFFNSSAVDSLDSPEQLFAPEEPAGTGETLSSINEEVGEPSSLPPRIHTLGMLSPSSRIRMIRRSRRFFPSPINNRFSPFSLGPDGLPSASVCQLASARRLSTYWVNLRNRTRSAFPDLISRSRFNLTNTSNNASSSGNNNNNGNPSIVNSEGVLNGSESPDVPLSTFRFRPRSFFSVDDMDTNSDGMPLENGSPYLHRAGGDYRRIYLQRMSQQEAQESSYPGATRTTDRLPSGPRARSVSPVPAHPWFPTSTDEDSFDDTSIGLRNNSTGNRSTTERLRDFRGRLNEIFEIRESVLRPNIMVPDFAAEISDDDSPMPRVPPPPNFSNPIMLATPRIITGNFNMVHGSGGGGGADITSTPSAPSAGTEPPTPPSNVSRTEMSSNISISTGNLKEIPQTYEDLNYELIQLLECPICFEYSTPPINQCLQGHIICSNCRQRVSTCPTCRNMFQESRNLVMEKVAALLRYPCKNAITGCAERLFLLQKEQHEQSCGFRHYVCFMPSCNWRGYKPELLVHFQEAHENNLIHGSTINLMIPITGQSKKVWLMSAFNELFYVIFFATIGILKSCVRYIGDSSKSDNYTYTISVTSEEEMMRNLNYTRTTHAYEETAENFDLLDSYDLFSISYPSLITFRRGPRAPVRVTVEEVPSRPRATN